MLDPLLKATDRAVDLVKQILLFSRQTEVERKLVEPHLIINEALKLLRSSIPASIDIKKNIPNDCGKIFVDPTQVHQIVMNLCTNAYYAMRKEGGTLSVSLSTIELAESDIASSQLDLVPGNYLKLEVMDIGHGMDQDDLGKGV